MRHNKQRSRQAPTVGQAQCQPCSNASQLQGRGQQQQQCDAQLEASFLPTSHFQAAREERSPSREAPVTDSCPSSCAGVPPDVVRRKALRAALLPPCMQHDQG